MKRRPLFTTLLVASFAAHASDGVIEIYHAKIMASSGYPYLISQPGSYRLTSNLTQADPDVGVIEIGASNVSLGLNGFAIIGPVTCALSIGDGPVTSCASAGAVAGIRITETSAGRANGVSNVRVMNGVIRGVGGGGVSLGPISQPRFSLEIPSPSIERCSLIPISGHSIFPTWGFRTEHPEGL